MVQTAMTNQEQSLRVDMAAGFRWLQRWEMDDLATGSLVARLSGNEGMDIHAHARRILQRDTRL